MSYPINYPTPHGANVQIFYASTESANNPLSSWVKPQGASFVWFTLIGGGGNGSGTPPSAFGGGSGAVTNFMCPAFLIPDVLQVKVSSGDSDNSVLLYQQKDGTGYTLLTANAGAASTAGAAMTANYFAAMGFFQSIAGQNGGAYTVSQTASATTFLSGGAGATVTSNYGYSTGTNDDGYFQMQPIIVGVAGGGGNGIGGIGCGAGYTNGVKGGPGMVVIITW